MTRIMIALAAGLAVSACAGGGSTPASEPVQAEYVPPPKRGLKPAEAMAEARKEVAVKLKDPESARFTDLTVKTSPNARNHPTDVVCGMVNAKNSYGGYVGAKPFVYMIDLRQSHTVDGRDSVVETAIYQRFCLGKTD